MPGEDQDKNKGLSDERIQEKKLQQEKKLASLPQGKVCDDYNENLRPDYHRYVCDNTNCPAITIAKPSAVEWKCANCSAAHNKSIFFISQEKRIMFSSRIASIAS